MAPRSREVPVASSHFVSPRNISNSQTHPTATHKFPTQQGCGDGNHSHLCARFPFPHPCNFGLALASWEKESDGEDDKRRKGKSEEERNDDFEEDASNNTDVRIRRFDLQDHGDED